MRIVGPMRKARGATPAARGQTRTVRRPAAAPAAIAHLKHRAAPRNTNYYLCDIQYHHCNSEPGSNPGVKTFSDRLKHARQLRGFTQHDLARVSGVSQSAIGSYESGQRQTSRSGRRLAQALDVDPDWLETGVGDMAVRERVSPHTLMEPPLPASRAAWPFRSLTAAQFHALSAEHQALLDTVLGALARGLEPPGQARGKRRNPAR